MFIYLKSFRLNPIQLTWIAALFFTTIGNIALWQTLWLTVDVYNLHSLLFFISLPIVLFGFLNVVLTPFLALPFLRKPLLILLVVLSASCTYFMLHYNIIIDRSMIQNIFETNQAEMNSYFSFSLISTIFLLGVLPATAMVLIPSKKIGHPLKTALSWLTNILITLVVLVVICLVFYKDYASLLRNNREFRNQVLPVTLVRNTNSYLKNKYYVKSQPFRTVGENATRSDNDKRPKLVIAVIGETARAQNFQLNGYPNATNPYLSKREDIISFKHVSSCGTATAISLPCMFSRMNRSQYDEVRAGSEENLLDILQRTGMNILWRNNNNGGCKGLCDRVPTEDMPALKVAEQCVNKDGTCYDNVLLNQLSTRIDTMQGDSLIVLHQQGSHGPTYFERYPAHNKVFSPTCDSNQIQKCSQEQLINTYDNTLVYTDQMLDKTIELLQRYSAERDVAMIYLSDHGESLGERGMYLHGSPYIIAPAEQTHVPMIMWFSPEFTQNTHINLACLQRNADNEEYSHDHFYHSILGLFSVQNSGVYESKLDLFATCRLT